MILLSARLAPVLGGLAGGAEVALLIIVQDLFLVHSEEVGVAEVVVVAGLATILLTDAFLLRAERRALAAVPKAPWNTFEAIANIADSLYILEVATVPGACIPCDANPLNLFCLCKICRKIGICKHILLTTHFVMASGPKEERKAICNLKYMTTSISGAKKGKGTQGGRAKAIALALEREEANDDDDNSLLQITW